jgi:hypothetical protein
VRRRWLAALILSTLASAAVLAVGGDKGQYIGGTINTLKEKAEAKFDTTSDKELYFDAAKNGRVSIAYANIKELEYGQKAGRRVNAAILVNPLFLFGKSRKHYLTVTYTDEAAKDQVGVFELGKNVFRPLLKILEVRSGKTVTMQDTEACKQYKTAKECEPGK